jgi:hypothetical protein
VQTYPRLTRLFRRRQPRGIHAGSRARSHGCSGLFGLVRAPLASSEERGLARCSFVRAGLGFERRTRGEAAVYRRERGRRSGYLAVGGSPSTARARRMGFDFLPDFKDMFSWPTDCAPARERRPPPHRRPTLAAPLPPGRHRLRPAHWPIGLRCACGRASPSNLCSPEIRPRVRAESSQEWRDSGPQTYRHFRIGGYCTDESSRCDETRPRTRPADTLDPRCRDPTHRVIDGFHSADTRTASVTCTRRGRSEKRVRTGDRVEVR